VQRADRIVVVNDANITEVGTHGELMALGGHYSALARAWEKSHAG
jgi:ABC-type multidrug transport system fused ATPase/permease subunit